MNVFLIHICRGKTKGMDEIKMNYLLGSSDEELGRLAFQHETWRPEAFDLWDRTGIKPGSSVLDLGCGPGFASLDLANLVGLNGKVISLDLSRKFLNHLNQVATSNGIKQIQAEEGNVESFVLSEKVDFVYSRWLFCFLRDPGKVVAQVAVNIKSGGRIAICDYFALDYLLFPGAPVFDRLLAAVSESWRLSGGNIRVQQSLPGMLEQHGFKIIELMPITRIARPNSAHWNCPKSFWKVFIPQLVSKGFFSQTDSDEFWIEINEREKSSFAILKTPTLLDIIAEKL